MSYTIAPMRPSSDRRAILELWRANLPEATPARYDWLYGRRVAQSWLLRGEDDQPIGSAGLMTRRMQVFDRRVVAGQAIDLNVRREHRSLGPAMRLQRTVVASREEDPESMIYAFPIASSEAVQRRVGYRMLWPLGSWARPLRFGPLLEDHLGATRLTKLAAAAATPWLVAQPAEIRHRCPPGFTVEITDQFDARFDRLWETARGQFPVIGERTATYLNWRFGEAPEARYRVLCLSDRRQELLGYVVYHREDGTVHVGDFLFAQFEYFDMLLAELLRQMRREKAELVKVVYLGRHEVCRRLRAFGFWNRPAPRNMLLHLGDGWTESRSRRLFDAENWYLTRADTDTDS